MFSNWCQDYSSVKNNMVSRDDILMEVNKILQTLNSIVYKLSVSRSQSEMNINVCQENISEFHHEEMWWDDAYVSLSMSVSQDVNNNNNNSNNLINNSECSSVIDDSVLQHVELFSNDSISDEEYELSIADRVKLRKSAQSLPICASHPEIQENQLARTQDPFIIKMCRFINICSPGNVFNMKKSRRRRHKKTAKLVHPELISMWNNVDDLFALKVSVPSTPDPSIPIVDWSKVNSRFIGNIPVPTPQPVHGCSSDPVFYEDRCSRKCQPSGHVTWEIRKSHHSNSKTPFGTQPGFLTDRGVISAESNQKTVHGYIWSPSCHQYILHAMFPGELERSEMSSKRRRKKKVPR